MKADFKKYIEREDSYFSESHLMAWFAQQYRGNTIDDVKHRLTVNHDNSGEIENAEEELGRKLTDEEQDILIDRFHNAVIDALETKNDVVVGFIDSLGNYCDEGY